MKKVALILLAVVSMALVSCGGGEKTITPTATRFRGDLGSLVEVVDQPCTITKVSKPTEQIELKVKIELVGSDYEGYDPTEDFAFCGGLCMSVLLIDLEDENGNTIGEAELRKSDQRRMRDFLTKPYGTTDDFVFICKQSWGVELSEKDFINSIAHFTPTYTTDICED